MLKAKPIKPSPSSENLGVRKHKQKKAPKAKKPRVKKASPIHEGYQASHYKTDQIHTQGFFNPFVHNSGIVQSTAVPRATISRGGIPYTSTFETYGITNKPPYFIESLIPQNIKSNYEVPKQSQTSTTISGSNPMSQPNLNEFPEQGKTQSVDYVDLVAPSKKGNSETQPDYITLQPLDGVTKPITKETLMDRSEYRKKNNIPPEKKVSEIMTAHGGPEALHRAKMEQHGFIKPKPSPSSKNSDARKPNLRVRKQKQNEEL